MNEESKEEEKRKHNVIVRYLKEMSSFEKLFWGTLFLFFIGYMVLITMASYRDTVSEKEYNRTVVAPVEIIHEIEVIVTSDRIKKNLENNRTVEEIRNNLQNNLLQLDQKIDQEVDTVFQTVFNNIDPFLDFHYSVTGEYLELGGMAVGKMEKMIEEKLFGSDFSRHFQNSLTAISDEFENRLSEHFAFINQKATTQVNMNLNSQIIDGLQKHIEQNIKLQGGKIAVLISAKFAPKLLQIAATKIAAKTGSKFAVKMTTKLGAKSAAAATGAASGALCGPAFWICSPIAAGVLWFGTDAVVNSIDEIYNREEFKKDIVDALVKQQNDLKRKLKHAYQRSAHKLSDEILVKYKRSPVKEIKRVKIKEKMGL